MADPATAAQHAATLQGQAAAIPIASAASAVFGIPIDLLGWAIFGGIVAEANTEPRQPPAPPLWHAARVALHLVVAAGLGGALASLGADVAIGLAAKVGVVLADGPLLDRAAAILIGFSTAFLPEAVRAARAKLGAMGGSAA